MPPIISVKNLTVELNHFTLLEHITFDIEKGDTLAIIGPNGSGKSTLIKALIGFIPIKTGKIEIACPDEKHARPEIAYVPQFYHFDRTFPITVDEFMSLSYDRKDASSVIHDRLRHVEMEKKSQSLLGTLSGGELQRVLIARAILLYPDILFMDEPEASIDVTGSRKFYQIIEHLKKKHQTTIVMVSHEIDIVYKYATKVLCLNRKMICYGRPTDILNSNTLKELYGDNVTVYQHHSATLP